MAPAPRDLLLGDRFQRTLDLLAAVVLFAGSFVAYATGLFAVDGGVVVLPADATVVGLIAAGVVGYQRGGVVLGWISVFAPLLGFHAEWAFLGLSGRSLPGRLAFLFDPVSLGVFAAASMLLGSVAFASGYLLGVGVERVRGSEAKA